MTAEPAPKDYPRASAISHATGTDFPTWVQRLDGAGARDLDHTAIARLLVKDWGVQEWWAQSLTVAYEQQIGRRVVGQSCEGDFSASASRTVGGDMDAVREAWDRFMTDARREQLGLSEGRLTDTEKWRYWRTDVEDGTKLSVNVTAKNGTAENDTAKNGTAKTDAASSSADSSAGDSSRSTLAIEHKGIETAEARDAWKSAWKSTLDDFTTWIKENRDL
ncbi:hypothetical protein M3F59_06095 [Brachybacterium muris]|uniref:hypothetical protein n=1 Tax=Brachybacterium muris TaxID=219301 RepID=UPI00223C1929|nr:hypothetical protein [Brachybacterium muris]MCT2178031.1 hypothetical protein [Brachybacterium muris]MCT2261196.1 hypothetical protein [Brachybacterium muris]